MRFSYFYPITMNTPSHPLQFRITAPLLIAVTLFSCHSPQPKQTVSTPLSNPVAAPVTHVDSTLIKAPCAILIYPTEAQVRKMEKENGEDFNTIADDNQYYMGTSTKYLDSIHCRTIDTSAHGPMRFLTASGQVIKLNLGKYDWAILLFNGKDTPVEADIMSMPENYKKYMK